MEIAQPISSLHLLCMAFLSPWWGKSKGGTAGWHKWREMYKLQSLPLLLTDYARKAYFHLNAFCHSGRLWNARLGKSVVSGELGWVQVSRLLVEQQSTASLTSFIHVSLVLEMLVFQFCAKSANKSTSCKRNTRQPAWKNGLWFMVLVWEKLQGSWAVLVYKWVLIISVDSFF